MLTFMLNVIIINLTVIKGVNTYEEVKTNMVMCREE